MRKFVFDRASGELVIEPITKMEYARELLIEMGMTLGRLFINACIGIVVLVFVAVGTHKTWVPDLITQVVSACHQIQSEQSP